MFRELILILAIAVLAYAFLHKFFSGRWPGFVKDLEMKID